MNFVKFLFFKAKKKRKWNFLKWISLYFTLIHFIDCSFLNCYPAFFSFSKRINKKNHFYAKIAFLQANSKRRTKNQTPTQKKSQMKNFYRRLRLCSVFWEMWQSTNCHACYFHSFIYFFHVFFFHFSRTKSVNESWMYRTNCSIANQR